MAKRPFGRYAPRCGREALFPAVLGLGLAAACTGTIGDEVGFDEGGPGSIPGAPGVAGGGPGVMGVFVPPEKELAATIGMRRLSTTEFDATVRTLLGDQSGIGSHSLPPDDRNFFDSYARQEGQIGDTLISSVDYVASDIARGFVSDATRRDRIVGCKPADAGCLETFVTRFGRLVFRRLLSEGEKQIYLNIPQAAQTTDDFYKSVELIVSAFLQDPEFINRVETGAPVKGVAGLFKLDAWELASRLSFLLWGDTPSPELLDHVEHENGLTTSADVAAVAGKMLVDARALGPVALFHELWLGYHGLSNADLRNETAALLGKVIFTEHAAWQDIFRADGTFVTFELAKNYGFAVPAGLTAGSKKTAWVSYPRTAVPRRGILSHGTLLSLGNKFGDTSPTIRGKEIRRRLLCLDTPRPDPKLLAMFKADIDQPPPGTGSLCKWDRYLANRKTSAACASCHDQIDLVGFGLENFDALGRYRTQQSWKKDAKGIPLLVAAGTPGAERCAIRADGAVDGKAFTGPGALADLLMGSGALSGCALAQLYRFGMEIGDLGGADEEVIERFRSYVGVGDFKLDDILLKLISSPAFAHRRMDLGQ